MARMVKFKCLECGAVRTVRVPIIDKEVCYKCGSHWLWDFKDYMRIKEWRQKNGFYKLDEKKVGVDKGKE
jgi:hypothetical protein